MVTRKLYKNPRVKRQWDKINKINYNRQKIEGQAEKKGYNVQNARENSAPSDAEMNTTSKACKQQVRKQTVIA